MLVFFGTLAQLTHGSHEVQESFFQSLFVCWSSPMGWKIPVFPGGHLLGAVLLVNLVAAHVKRFRWTSNKLGIQLIHAGLIIMLAGGFFTDLFSIESFMRLTPGETRNYSEDPRAMELAVIDLSSNGTGRVITIPDVGWGTDDVIQHKELPFKLRTRKYFHNSTLQFLDKSPSNVQAASSQGFGTNVAVTEVPSVISEEKRDSESLVVDILPEHHDAQGISSSLGTWLLSEHFEKPQTFTAGGKTWGLVLRLRRYEKPYNLTLQKFTHDRFAGTEIAKSFVSRLSLDDREMKENRDVVISMNHPFRYRGDTFYQSGFEKEDSATVLQVVHNPVSIAPYLACVIVAVGLLIQFGSHLYGFMRRRNLQPER
jgi:hypothetical protein